jgi:hypothetical protein
LAVAVGGCSGGTNFVETIKDDIKQGNTFEKPVFATPDWAKVTRIKTAELGPRGPVGPEDLVSADGSCAPESAPAPSAQAAAPQAAAQEQAAQPAEPAEPAEPPADAAYGSLAGDLAGKPMPQGPPPQTRQTKQMKQTRRQVASTDPAAGLGGLQPEGLFGPPGGGGGVIGGIALGMTECQAVRRAGRPNQVNIGSADQGARKVVLTYPAGPWPGVYTFESGRLKVVDAMPEPVKPTPQKKRPPTRRGPAHTATNVTVR